MTNIDLYVDRAAYYIEQSLIYLELAREKDKAAKLAIDHIVDERKLQHIADRLRILAAEAVS